MTSPRGLLCLHTTTLGGISRWEMMCFEIAGIQVLPGPLNLRIDTFSHG